LRSEAIRLARALVELMPDEPEAVGLLALMLLNESRARGRRADGEIVLLRDQDRTKWDRPLIGEGQAIVRACIRRGRPAPYQIQAAIQAVHSEADSLGSTDWGTDRRAVRPAARGDAHAHRRAQPSDRDRGG
jgi:RNA polymerase sigma-70 factor (ECF subfamily)